MQPSSSPYGSPMVLVGKKDGSWRLCVDVKDRFLMPIVEELLDELGQVTMFTKLDMRSGYHQLRIHRDDVFKKNLKH